MTDKQMKLISEGHERNWYLIRDWTTKAGLRARVLKCVWSPEVKGIASLLHDFYTGYVQKDSEDKTRYYDTDAVSVHGGVTFEGTQTGLDGNEMNVPGEWVGFDMAHLGDEKFISSEYAEEECESLAEQMKRHE